MSYCSAGNETITFVQRCRFQNHSRRLKTKERSFNGKPGRHFVDLTCNKYKREVNRKHEQKEKRLLLERRDCLMLELKAAGRCRNKHPSSFKERVVSERGRRRMSNWTREGNAPPKRPRAWLCFPVHQVMYGRDRQRFTLVSPRGLKEVDHSTAGLRTPAS